MIRTFIGIILFLATAAPGCAAVVRLSEVSAGRFLVEGEGLANVAALNLVIDYDPTTWQVSEVSAGSLLQGMLFAGNPNQVGRVQIGAVGTRAISGSGILGIINGTVKGPPVVILGVTAKIRDSSGRPLSVRTQYPKSSLIENQTQPDLASNPQPVASSSPASTSQSNPVVSVGNLDLSNPWSAREMETSPAAEDLEPYVASLPENDPQTQEVPRHSAESYVEKQQVRFPSVLEVFNEYKGPRTLTKMMMLFNRNGVGHLQNPKILLTDGKTPVEIEFQVKNGQTASIALKNALLLWSGPVGEGRFLVRCIPEKGALSAKVLYLGREDMLSIPLTLAPPVLIVEMKIQKQQPLPKLDLDGDDKFTWRDDYILVANLLVQRMTGRSSGMETIKNQ